MNTLLPKSDSDFSTVNYWDKFFKNRSKSFDWYGEYIELIDLYTKYVKPQDDILVIGCGNSTLSHDLFVKQNCSRVFSIDISKTVIDQMLSKYSKIIRKITDKKSNAFDFKCLDVCQLSSDSEIRPLLPFTCAIDKGTTDAIHSSGSDSSENETITKMWTEIDKNLSVMGRYILITLAQSHIVDSIINFFLNSNGNQWMVNVHEIVNDISDENGFNLPVFAFVFYKMKPNPSLPLVYIDENAFRKSNNRSKVEKKLMKIPVDQLKQWILSRQQLSILSHSIRENKQTESVIDMKSQQSGLIRYHCRLVNNHYNTKKKSDKIVYCVFIVPFGQNDSEIVSSKEARLKLCRDHLKCRVCLFVFLNPREYYVNRQSIQDELNSLAIKFCPNDVPSNYSIPYVSCHDLVYNSNIVEIDNCLLETLVTPSGDVTRLLSFGENKSVLVSDTVLSRRDELIEKYIEISSQIYNEEINGVYYGDSCCVPLNNNWRLLELKSNSQIGKSVTENLKINYINCVDQCGTINCLIYDSLTIDRELVDKLLRHLSDDGIAIFCSDNAAVVSNLSFGTVFAGEIIDSTTNTKTEFSFFSKSKKNMDLLKDVFNDFNQ